MRHLLGGMLEETGVVTVIDMEAGLEHLSRGTGRHVDVLLVTAEPYYKALETARRCAELGRELDIGQVVGVANKLRGDEDRAVVRQYAESHAIPLIAEVPFDEAIYRADLAGQAPDLAGHSPAVQAIRSLARALRL